MFELYKVLQLSQNASDEDIKKAYRKLAKQYHPDVNPNNKEAEKKFNQISEAYNILGTPIKRKEYDLSQKNGTGTKPKTAKTTTSSQPIDFTTYSKSFDNFFGFDIKNGTKIEKETQKKKNPLDASDIFEKFMGFKG